MPTKLQDDTSYWRARQARLKNPAPKPSEYPAVLPSEDPADYALLVAEYYARFNPTLPEERGYVDDIIYCEWILRRLVRTETELTTFVYLDCTHSHPDFPLGQPAAERAKLFTAVQWRAISTRKALKEALAGLRDLRLHPIKDAKPAPAPEIEVPPPPATASEHTSSPQIGFVLESRREPDPGLTGEPPQPPPSHAT
jgi:hypothetical protein